MDTRLTSLFPTDRYPTVEEVAAMQDALSRKFEASDVDHLLWQVATKYAKTYQGDFPFIVDMKKAALGRGLSDGQAKGVLNCMAAAGRRVAAEATPAAAPVAAQPEAPVAEVPDGIYAVEVDGETVVLRIEVPTWGSFDEGTRAVKYKTGPDAGSERAWNGFAFLLADGTVNVWKSRQWAVKQAAALRALLHSDDPLQYGFAYALLSGRCFVCNLELDDPVSVKAGIGPTCAKKHGIQREKLTAEERSLTAKRAAIVRGAA